jgi:hypothetical protein
MIYLVLMSKTDESFKMFFLCNVMIQNDIVE